MGRQRDCSVIFLQLRGVNLNLYRPFVLRLFLLTVSQNRDVSSMCKCNMKDLDEDSVRCHITLSGEPNEPARVFCCFPVLDESLLKKRLLISMLISNLVKLNKNVSKPDEFIHLSKTCSSSIVVCRGSAGQTSCPPVTASIAELPDLFMNLPKSL